MILSPIVNYFPAILNVAGISWLFPLPLLLTENCRQGVILRPIRFPRFSGMVLR
jgi:hypothetical protein